MLRTHFVLLLCCLGCCFTLRGDASNVYGWTDQSFTSLKTAGQMETPVELKFDDVPLQTAVETLCLKAGLDVVWDASCTAENELSAYETVALSSSQPMALRRALALILEPCYLTWEPQGDRQLRIVSRKQWNEQIVTVTYNVRELIKAHDADFDLPSLIQKTVTPRDWQSGKNTVAGYMLLVDGELQVTQHRSAQQEVAAFLTKLSPSKANE